MKLALALATLLVAAPAFAQDDEPAHARPVRPGQSGDSSSNSSSDASSPKGEAKTEAAPTFRKRYSPGFSVGALTVVRSYEGLDGSAFGVGAGVGWAWDLVSVDAQVIQSVAVVGERKPTELKLNADYAFATFGGFSVLGLLGLDYTLNGPDRQTTHVPGNLFGPEMGIGARYRFMPLFDIVAYWTAETVAARNGPQRMFFEPGVIAAVQVHPFGSDE
ncbi:MAG: outer membrane beta-barrel protein [Deltaproteobacteria bacterium]|nr:outer membrane beta-barrel protein [Deltaproteobacteria bacterium]